MVCFDVFYDVVSFDGYLFIHWSGLVLFIIHEANKRAQCSKLLWAPNIICSVDISIKFTFVVQ